MYSRASFTGTGAVTPYTFPFQYLDKAHIEVRINDVPTGAFSWINSSAVSVNAPVGSTVEIRRNTPKTPAEVTYQDASTLTESDLNLETLQLLYCMQEAIDEASTKMGYVYPGMFNALGNRIVNLGDPAAATDAATKRYVDSTSASNSVADRAYADAGDASTRAFATAADVVAVDTAKRYAEQIMAGAGSGTGVFIQDGTGAVPRTFQDKARESKKVADFGAVGDGSTTDDSAFSKFEAKFKNTVVDLEGKVYAVSAIPTQNSYRNGGFKLGGKVRWTHEPASFFGRSGSAQYYGGQLKRLLAALSDPFTQLLGIAYIGDSITWGSGASGMEATEPRNGTLGDPRDSAATGSYVNNMKRWFAEQLGSSWAVTTTHQDWPYATVGAGNGQCITTHSRDLTLGLVDDGGFTYGGTGVMSTDDSPASDAGRQRRWSIAQNQNAWFEFKLTGEEFYVVHDGTGASGSYRVLLNGTDIGGDNMQGATVYYNRRTKYSFPFVRNATVRVYMSNTGAATVTNYMGGILITKKIRIKNQGINGADTRSYLTYNFPTTNTTQPPYKKAESEFGATITVTGNSNKSVASRPTITGEQIQLDMYTDGAYTVVCPIPAGADRLGIAYSQIGNGGTVDVFNGGALIDSFSTQGQPSYQQQHIVTVPPGATSLTLKNRVAENPASLYLEGLVAFNYTASTTYPTNNGFGKGVALETSDSFAFFQLGTNDRIKSLNGSWNTVQQLKTNLKKMLSLLPIGCDAILMSANAALNDGLPTYYLGMRDVRAAIRDVAASVGKDHIDNTEPFVGAPVMAFTGDGLHPHELGYRIMSSNQQDAILHAR
ncbi:phage tail fiber protein [Burkholderia sp. B21-005]|uniref:phage tail fiber domain-containing protein n=1 Tax=Burkholderia sp. B21-005 TaxID=2890406 RepID=UPI001E3EAE29|nr:phage tail fiber protein [Burkholderia sp. B21-005]UEP39984.1 hypothetical protein LMA02_08965 [Burkholderia sp. B21-005]